jgi:hypothetical protein
MLTMLVEIAASRCPPARGGAVPAIFGAVLSSGGLSTASHFTDAHAGDPDDPLIFSVVYDS